MRISGGLPVGPDGRCHTTFGHNPSSLRLCSFDPNLQNIPRGSAKEKAVEKWVKEMFVASPGKLLWERDYRAIEAVLVGYFSGSRSYYQFAKLGVHDYLTSHMIGQPADLSWGEKQLIDYFKSIKKDYSETRDRAKRVVHGSNYMMSPARMHQLYPETFPRASDAAKLQGLYFELFPEIRQWHKNLCINVDGTKRRKAEKGEEIDPWTLGTCFAKNPFKYVHHFYNVLDWELIKYEDGSKEWIWTYGEDAKRLVSFLPQSTAAAIIKRAAKDLWYNLPWVGETMRLLIHDSILGEQSKKEIETCLELSRKTMEKPILALPLDPTWNLGEFLQVDTEAKIGKSWGTMQ